MAAQSVTCLAKMYLALKLLVLFDITGFRAESGDPSVGPSDHSLSGILTLYLYNFPY